MVKVNTRDIQNAASDAVRAISDAAAKATSVIAQAAETAAKVVSNNAEVQAKVIALPTLQETNDHNLLIKLDTKVDNIQQDLTSLKNQHNGYVIKPEFIEVVRIQADHETRTRVLERSTTQIVTWGSALVVFVGIVEFLINKFILK